MPLILWHLSTFGTSNSILHNNTSFIIHESRSSFTNSIGVRIWATNLRNLLFSIDLHGFQISNLFFSLNLHDIFRFSSDLSLRQTKKQLGSEKNLKFLRFSLSSIFFLLKTCLPSWVAEIFGNLFLTCLLDIPLDFGLTNLQVFFFFFKL